MKTLKDLFLDELADIYDAEQRIVKALPKLEKAATCEELKAALKSHLVETQGHVKTLEEVFRCFEQKPKGKTCEATVGLLAEGDEIVAEFKGSPVINAAIVAAAQKVEHYEMASYGCLHEWAGLLGNKEAAGLLQGILGEEKAANNSLTELARATCNEEALGEPGATSAKKPDPRPASGNPGRPSGGSLRAEAPGSGRPTAEPGGPASSRPSGRDQQSQTR